MAASHSRVGGPGTALS